jgi:hypothetical protein
MHFVSVCICQNAYHFSRPVLKNPFFPSSLVPQIPIETLDQSTDSSSSLSEEAFSFCPGMYFNIIYAL